MNHRKQHLDRILEQGYEFKFGEYISRGLEIFQKNIGGYVAYALLAIVILAVSSILLSLIPFAGSLVQSVFVTPPLTVGAYIVAHLINKGQEADFSRFFDGFQHVPQLALTALVMSAILLVSILPMFAIWGVSGFFDAFIFLEDDPERVLELFSNFPLWSLIFLIPFIYFAIAYSWAYHFVVFFELNYWDALEYSRKMVSKHWFVTFAFFLVLGILGSLGFILLFIGIIFTYPIMLCAQYAAFADITRLLEEDEMEENDLLDHLVD